MKRIDSVQDFQEVRKTFVPEYIQSQSQGPILVPCVNTLLVKTELIVANTYNPNSVPADKMALLRQSILDNGFCFPIVAIWDEGIEKFVVVDGFHRSTIGGASWLDLDYLPVVVLDHDISQRMAATVQFNKARGFHQVDLDAEVIRALIEQGLSDEDVATKLGLDLDTVHRYKQISGVAALFSKTDYSLAWEMTEEMTEE